MLLQVAKSGLPRHGKPACKSLNRTRQKRYFVLTHNKSLQLPAAKLVFFFDICKYFSKNRSKKCVLQRKWY